ncbi:MAG: MerR family transcriptional regulator [Chloroflexi bacterium]|nr:MerR family transcriptional regulator [Chloroflexota bacterium]
MPVSALRYYADTGLLTPVHVDPITGYRYYTFDQLPQLNRILALKIWAFAGQHPPASGRSDLSAEIQGMLRLREAELAQQVCRRAVPAPARSSLRLRSDSAGDSGDGPGSGGADDRCTARALRSRSDTRVAIRSRRCWSSWSSPWVPKAEVLLHRR